MRLTQDNILALEVPLDKESRKPKTDHIEWDDDLEGFGARIRAVGAKTWVVQYRTDHNQRRETLGKVQVLKQRDGGLADDLDAPAMVLADQLHHDPRRRCSVRRLQRINLCQQLLSTSHFWSQIDAD